jgi:hypothetical protein
MDNPYLPKAISATKNLQLLITKMVEFEKDLQERLGSAEWWCGPGATPYGPTFPHIAQIGEVSGLDSSG